jgi:GDP-L-fucose synthase
MRKVFITGGSGFIGRNLTESILREEYALHAPKRAELDLSDEVEVRSYLRAHRFDVIVHTAIKPAHRGAKDPTKILLSNLRMFLNLSRNEDSFGKMIVLGSGSVYDMRYYVPRMQEAYFDAHVPIDELGLYKYTVSKTIEKKPNYTDLRIFGIYGKYEDYSIRFISNMICKALFDLPLTMNQDRVFDYLWIDDLIPIIEHFIESDESPGAYNVTPSKGKLLSEIARIVLKATGKDLPIAIKIEGLGSEYSGDNARLMQEMPNLRFTPLERGIELLTEYYRNSIDEIDRSILLADR